MNTATVLLSGGDTRLIDSVEGVVASVAGLGLEICSGPDEAWARVARGGIALVILHLAGAGEALGAEAFVRRACRTRRPTPVVALHDADDPSRHLALFRLGVVDSLSRPLDLGRLGYLVDAHTVEARLTRPDRPAEPVVAALGEDDLFLYVRDTAMSPLMEQVHRVAPQATTLLLGGETGTGKTRLARLIHELSGRGAEPFLTVHCAALSASLIESEMFGHVRGAFTGADRDRAGKFAEVGAGTLLLDDIDALPLSLQAKLLRAVEERVFEPVGANRTQPLRARLIAASNRPLDQEVAAGRFRADLYYRLNVVGFHLPPLRERRAVVPHIARKFVADYGIATGRPMRGVTPAALAALGAHDWPGNVRELRNVIERAVALCAGDVIDIRDLPDALRSLAPEPRPAPAEPAAAPLTRSKEEAELLCITEALERHGNNRLRAAAALGISRMTLYKKLRKYGLMSTA